MIVFKEFKHLNSENAPIILRENGVYYVEADWAEKLLTIREQKLRDRALVLMHKKTGKLFEYFWSGCFGDVITWKDTSENDGPINKNSPIMFNDDKRFNLNDYEILSPL